MAALAIALAIPEYQCEQDDLCEKNVTTVHDDDDKEYDLLSKAMWMQLK